jgi:hypothetical protein
MWFITFQILPYHFGSCRPSLEFKFQLFLFVFFYFNLRNCRSVRGAAAANSVSTDVGIFIGSYVLIKDLLDADIFGK